jgi:hypothetical protein
MARRNDPVQRLYQDFADHERFCRECLTIRDKSGNPVPFLLQPAQVKLHKLIAELREHRRPVRIIALKARQVMVSTAVAGEFFHTIGFATGQKALIVAHEDRASRNIFGYYKQLHQSYQPFGGVIRRLDEESLREQQGEIDYAGGGWIHVSTANNLKTGRSFSLRFLHLSEYAFWRDARTLMTGLMQCVPDDPDTAAIIESTANGVGGDFYQKWQEANDPSSGSEWVPFFFAWWEHPEYSRPVSDPAAFQSSLTKEERELQQKFSLTLAQLHWRRWAIRNKCQSSPDVFKQEFPACVTGETLVSTERGLVRIRDVGDCQWTESGRIKKAGPQPMSQIFRLTTKRGRVLRGTYDHPVATPEGEFIFLSELQPGQRIQLRPPRFAEQPYRLAWGLIPGAACTVEVDEAWGRFLGFFMGDGSWHADTLSIACDAQDEDVVGIAEAAIAKTVGRPNARQIERVKGRKGCAEWRLTCKAARKVLDQLGALYVNANGEGTWKRRVCVPEAIFQSPKPVVRAFLQALFESDGSASAHKVRFGSSKLEFVRDVQLLLLGFGINSRIAANPKTNGKGYRFDFWVLELGVEASRLFFAEIGFLGERKRNLNFKHSPGTLTAKGQRYGRPPLPNDMTDEVESVVKDGWEITYDLTVEPDHVFSANGILTHNTPEEAFLFSGRPRFSHASLAKMPAARRSHEESREAGIVGELVEELDGPKPRIIFEPDADRRGALTLYKRPQPGRLYSFGIDVAEGIDVNADQLGNADPDYSVCEVVDLDTGEQVAKLRGRIEPAAFAEYVDCLARWYGSLRDAQHLDPRTSCFLVPEANGPGIAFLEQIIRGGYPPFMIYHRQRSPEAEFSSGDSTELQLLGWRTTTVTRVQLISFHDQCIRERSYLINDPNTLLEHRHFVTKANGKAEAVEGGHDDEVVASALAMKGVQTFPKDERIKLLNRGKPPILDNRHASIRRYGRRRLPGVTEQRGDLVRW